jgi:predicted phosphodiesterase
MSTVLVIPDYQTPFEHEDAIEFLKLVKKTHNPDIVVQIGDLLDQHYYSKYGPSSKATDGKEEIRQAVINLKAGLYKLFPDVFVCWGNHDLRISTRASAAGLDSSLLKTYEEIIQSPKGWQFADKWEIDGVIYEHGIGRSGYQGALKAAQSNMQSTVIGHLHSCAGILWYGNKKNLIFGFNVGALVDDNKYAFEYARFSSQKSILGCGLVIDGTPVFIPMRLNRDGRWVKKL